MYEQDRWPMHGVKMQLFLDTDQTCDQNGRRKLCAGNMATMCFCNEVYCRTRDGHYCVMN